MYNNEVRLLTDSSLFSPLLILKETLGGHFMRGCICTLTPRDGGGAWLRLGWRRHICSELRGVNAHNYHQTLTHIMHTLTIHCFCCPSPPSQTLSFYTAPTHHLSLAFLDVLTGVGSWVWALGGGSVHVGAAQTLLFTTWLFADWRDSRQGSIGMTNSCT